MTVSVVVLSGHNFVRVEKFLEDGFSSDIDKLEPHQEKPFFLEQGEALEIVEMDHLG